MTTFAYSLFGFILAVGVLVTVHEFGHFWVARKLGVRVLKFSIGFGKPLFAWRRKNDATEYVIGMIPLGGYVKMLDENEADVAESEKAHAFNRQSLGVRSAIVVAGPGFNFLFAIFAAWLVFVGGAPDIKPVVGRVLDDSLAADAGFLPGDELRAVDGRAVHSWGEHQFYLLHRAMLGKPAEFVVQRPTGDARLRVDFADFDQRQIGRIAVTSAMGIFPPAPPAMITRVVADSPAARAGLQHGDLITAINDEPVADWVQLTTIVAAAPGETLRLSVLRDSLAREIFVTANTLTIDGRTYGQIGAYHPPAQNMQLRLSPFAAFGAALDYNWRAIAITMRSIGRMLSARMSTENLAGPIGIAKLAGDTVKSGYADFLRFLAVISISLGLLNLLPIPLLDGGHLLYFLIEAVKGAPPSPAVIYRAQQIGVCLLTLLIGAAFYNDIARLFGG